MGLEQTLPWYNLENPNIDQLQTNCSGEKERIWDRFPRHPLTVDLLRTFLYDHVDEVWDGTDLVYSHTSSHNKSDCTGSVRYQQEQFDFRTTSSQERPITERTPLFRCNPRSLEDDDESIEDERIEDQPRTPYLATIENSLNPHKWIIRLRSGIYDSSYEGETMVHEAIHAIYRCYGRTTIERCEHESDLDVAIRNMEEGAIEELAKYFYSEHEPEIGKLLDEFFGRKRETISHRDPLDDLQ